MKFLILSVIVCAVLAANIDQKLLDQVKSQGNADIFIDVKGRTNFADLKNTLKTLDRIQLGRFVVDHLQQVAETTQHDLREFLKKEKIEYIDLWIQNSLLVKNAKISLIRKLAERIEVAAIRLDEQVDAMSGIEKPEPFTIMDKNPTTVEHNVQWVKADKVWAQGHTGEGMVVALSDTGAQFKHEALIKSYRGNKDGKINHNFSWFDPSSQSTTPQDTNGHGTHVAGTAAGGAGGRKVGIAPGAKWIACRPFGGRSSAQSNFVRCNQFFLAPHDLQGRNANPDLRPHSTSHSYVCRGGCGMEPSIKALKAAGVFFIKSCGNSGSRCGTITDPGNYDDVYCIAALTKGTNTVTSFSSRGPSQGKVIKPSFSAPGHMVNSAWISRWSQNTYRAISGTSMAAPCFNGAVALLWSACDWLVRDIDETVKVFQESSLRQESTACNSPQPSPNHLYGYGTINLEKAVEVAKRRRKQRNLK